MSAQFDSDEDLEIYKTIFDNSLDAVLLIRTDFSIFYANPSAQELFGYTEGEISDLGREGLVDVNPNLPHMLKERERTGKAKGELTLIKKNGLKFPAEISTNIFKDKNGIENTLMIIKDITERKKAEKDILESSNLLNLVLESISDPIYVKDHESRIVMANSALGKVVGKPLDQIVGKTDDEYYENEKIGKALREHDLEVMKSGSNKVMEETTLTPNGYKTFISNKTPHYDANGKIIGIIGISHDVTEQKQFENALKAGEKNYRHLLQYAPTAIYEIDFKGPRFKSVNDAMCQLSGYSREELLSTNPLDLLDSKSQERFQQRIRKALTGEEIDENVDYTVIHKDGRKLWVTLNIKPTYTDGKIDGALVVGHDVTERKKAEELVLKAKEQSEVDRNRLESILETTPSAVIIVDASNSKISYINKRAKQLYGIDITNLNLDDAVDKVKAKRVNGSEYPVGESPTGRALKGQEVDNEELIMEQDNGLVIPILASAAPIINSEGKIIAAVSIFDDITERKKADLALKKSQKKYKSLFSSMNEGVAIHRMIYDQEGKAVDYIIMDVNPSYEKILGIKRENVINKKASEIYGTGKPPYLDIYSSVAETGNSELFETYFKPMDKHFSISVFSPKQGEFATIFEDITNRHIAKQTLKASIQRFKTLADFTYDWEYWVDPKGHFVYTSPSCERITGHKPEEFEKDPNLIIKIIHPEDQEMFKKHLQSELTNEEPVSMEFRLINKKGEEKWIAHICQPVYNKEGSFLGRRASNRDDTQRKIAENELKLSESRFRSVLQNSQDVIYRFNLQTGSYEYMSPAIRDLGFEIKEMMAMSEDEVMSRVHPDDQPELLSILSQINQKGKGTAEYRFRGNDDTYRWWSNQMVIIKDSDDKPLYRDGSVRDITKRKQAEVKVYRRGILLNGINTILEEALTCETVKEVVGKCLEVAEELTHSEFGFIGEINDRGRLDDRAISPPGWEKCEVSDALELVKNMEIVSYWGRTVKEQKSQIVNNPDSDPDKRGLPEGHPPITSFLGVPLKQSGQTIGMIALANKEDGYTQEDQANIEIISDVIVETMMRKRAEQQLNETLDNLELQVKERTADLSTERQRFYSVLETLPVMICLLTPDYHVAFANRSFREMFGESRGRPCYEYCFGLSEPCEFCESFKVLETGEPHHWEVNGPDGSFIDVYDFPFVDVDGSPMILEMDIDITQRKKAEEALERLNIYNRNLLETALDPLVTIGPDGKITDLNKATEQVTGFSRKELVGSDFADYFTNPYSAAEGYKQVLEKGEVRDYPLDIKHKDGSTTPVLYNASVYKDESGEVIGVFAAARDITERKESEKVVKEYWESLEEQVELRTEELAKSNADLKQFAYVASHDLREPLRMITSFLQLLERRYKDQLDQDANDFIGFAVDGAKRLDSMIIDLLEYSRVANKEMLYKDVNMQEIVEKVIWNLNFLIEENSAQITYNSLPKIRADESQMVRLLQNLIENAIKYRREETPQINIFANKQNGTVVFGVKDNGIGIDAQHLERIFTIFKRLHTHEEYEGTGIGLALAQRIVHQHGGEIWVESELDKGSTFHFSVPVE